METQSLEILLNETIEIQVQIEQLTETYNLLKSKLKASMKDQNLSKLLSNKAKAVYSEFLSETFDKQAFKHNCPKIYARYSGKQLRERIIITACN